MQTLYLESDRAEMLDALAEKTRLPKAILLREAVDDLLIKHKVLKEPKRQK
jgi:predicted transcriptional regulator